jgi:CHAT domain
VLRLRTESVRDDHRRRLVLYDADDEVIFTTDPVLDTSIVLEARRLIRETLDEFRYALRDRPQTLASAGCAITRLVLGGLQVIGLIFAGKVRELEEAFQRHCPAWVLGEQPAQVSLTSDLSVFLPVELLPVFGIRDCEPDEVASFEDLERVLRRFPGFSTVVGRELLSRDSIPQGQEIDNHDGLRLALFCDEQPNSRLAWPAEAKFFNENSAFAVRGPWPPPYPPMAKTAVVNELVFQLRYGQTVTGHEQSFDRDHVHHFGCHCTTLDVPPSDAWLSLTQGGQIMIRDLHGAMAVWERLNGHPRGIPLVFMNACLSGHLGSEISFPWFFLNYNRNRCFIGTETEVPGDFAAEFSRTFYTHLLGGLSIGEALYATKWQLYHESGNPLGLIYNAYGDLDLRVTSPVTLTPQSAETP